MSVGLYLELLPGRGFALPANPRLFLGERAVRLGRGPENDLVLADETVSGGHATVSVERGEVRVRDHGSTNGTFIDELRVDGQETLKRGQVLRLGVHTRLRLGSTLEDAPVVPAFRLEVLETGACVALPQGGLGVGSGPAVDLALVLDGGEAFSVRPTPRGAAVTWQGRAFDVAPGVAFAVGGIHFRLLSAEGPAVPTVGARSPTDAYRLRVALDGPTGAEAVLTDPERHLVLRVTTENRAVLLYVLAARMNEDRAGRRRTDEQGWCSDDEVAAGIWGREAARIQANNLNVLLHRLRREIEDAGFDPSFLEKRQKALRVRLVHVALG